MSQQANIWLFLTELALPLNLGSKKGQVTGYSMYYFCIFYWQDRGGIFLGFSAQIPVITWLTLCVGIVIEEEA